MPIRVRLPLLAAAVALTVSPAAQAAPAAWTVDKAASKLTFKSAFSGEDFEGAFRRWDAQIQFDPKALAASRVVVTVEPGSAATGSSERDDALPTADWFNVVKFPKATFVTRSFKDLGGGRYQAIGDLTIRGVTKPLTLPFTLVITGDTAKMSSTVAINRNAFGVGQGQFASAETVPLNVTLNVSLTARRGK
jgi:polyisoprenoid-binding protein YceI